MLLFKIVIPSSSNIICIQNVNIGSQNIHVWVNNSPTVMLQLWHKMLATHEARHKEKTFTKLNSWPAESWRCGNTMRHQFQSLTLLSERHFNTVRQAIPAQSVHHRNGSRVTTDTCTNGVRTPEADKLKQLAFHVPTHFLPQLHKRVPKMSDRIRERKVRVETRGMLGNSPTENVSCTVMFSSPNMCL